MISREEVLTACQEGADRVWAIIAHLQQQLAEKGRHIQALEEEIRLLKHRLGQHSQNSHNPPSADRFVKPRSLHRTSAPGVVRRSLINPSPTRSGARSSTSPHSGCRSPNTGSPPSSVPPAANSTGPHPPPVSSSRPNTDPRSWP